ncbi:MAG: response regulator [Bacteroidia bacterium]|jgi:DNA-binding LytR/AlgR family response regulator|nr:response regulator [Bacteroidia bacterium]
MQKISLLIVEDQIAIALDIEQRLLDMGYEVAGIAANASEARTMLENSDVDIVLLDINLGEHEEDGIQLAATLKGKNISCIFLTAYTDSATFSRALQLAPAGYLLKPFRNEELQRQVLLAVQAHRQLQNENQIQLLLREAVFETNSPWALLDSDYQIVRMNRSMEKLSGFTSAEVQNRPAERIFAFENEKLKSINHRNGETLPLTGLISPVKVSTGQYAGFFLRANSLNEEHSDSEDESTPHPAAFFVRDKGQLIRVPVTDICWLEAVDNYTRLHTRKGRFMVKQFLKDLVKQLPQTDFVRIHRSFAVSLGEITSMEGDTVYLTQQALPVGKQYRNDLLRRIAIL